MRRGGRVGRRDISQKWFKIVSRKRRVEESVRMRGKVQPGVPKGSAFIFGREKRREKKKGEGSVGPRRVTWMIYTPLD